MEVGTFHLAAPLQNFLMDTRRTYVTKSRRHPHKPVVNQILLRVVLAFYPLKEEQSVMGGDDAEVYEPPEIESDDDSRHVDWGVGRPSG
ncbi:hypothetical protein HAX54_013182 [Datura stramonium]|uniref:Uncharacterized protein n=1 Tax=Datura stramonium TaxID=4076 RepID=A0ABS8TKV3_DATST|nr:hypothetical protein [Datura stramonium]